MKTANLGILVSIVLRSPIYSIHNAFVNQPRDLEGFIQIGSSARAAIRRRTIIQPTIQDWTHWAALRVPSSSSVIVKVDEDKDLCTTLFSASLLLSVSESWWFCRTAPGRGRGGQLQTRAFQMQPQLLFIWNLSLHNKPFQEVKVDGFVALQGRRRQLLVQTLLHFKVKLHFYILAPFAPCYFCQVFCANHISIGWFFNCSSQFSVPKWKTMGSQSEILFHEILDVQMILVGWTTFFFLALKYGRNS